MVGIVGREIRQNILSDGIERRNEDEGEPLSALVDQRNSVRVLA